MTQISFFLLFSFFFLGSIALPSRPNIVLIVTDQERKPPEYEPQQYKEYREKFLVGRQKIEKNAVRFKNHYIASAACVPSRACLYTGQHIDLTGVSQTSGLAKSDKDIDWLNPEWVPTLGHLLSAPCSSSCSPSSAPYKTHYIGKWHLSSEDLGRDGIVVPVFKGWDTNFEGEVVGGEIDEELENEYLEQDRLKKYGFPGWVGPEPHGGNFDMSGTVRDVEYGKRVEKYLKEKGKEKERGEDGEPWMLAVNLVNPHDIVLLQALAWWGYGEVIDDGTCPKNRSYPSPSRHQEELPPVYKQSLALIRPFFNGELIFTEEEEACFYHLLMKRVDAEIERIFDTLKNSGLLDDTVILMTSDHGELLHSHGGGMEKWYTAYEEVIRVPFVVSHPSIVGRDEHMLTSHLDITPTILGLAGIDKDEAIKRTYKTHAQARPLPGKNLSPIINNNNNNNNNNDDDDKLVYFLTRDNPFLGPTRLSPVGRIIPSFLASFLSPYVSYDAPWGTNTIESVIHFIGEKKYKLIAYVDDPNYWSTPHKQHTQDILSFLSFYEIGSVLTRDTPLPNDYELFCLDDDPFELKNLYTLDSSIVLHMMEKLEKARQKYRLQPNQPLPPSPPPREEIHHLPQVPKKTKKIVKMVIATVATVVVMVLMRVILG